MHHRRRTRAAAAATPTEEHNGELGLSTTERCSTNAALGTKVEIGTPKHATVEPTEGFPDACGIAAECTTAVELEAAAAATPTEEHNGELGLATTERYSTNAAPSTVAGSGAAAATPTEEHSGELGLATSERCSTNAMPISAASAEFAEKLGVGLDSTDERAARTCATECATVAVLRTVAAFALAEELGVGLDGTDERAARTCATECATFAGSTDDCRRFRAR